MSFIASSTTAHFVVVIQPQNSEIESNSDIEEMRTCLRDKMSLQFHLTGHDLQTLVDHKLIT